MYGAICLPWVTSETTVCATAATPITELRLLQDFCRCKHELGVEPELVVVATGVDKGLLNQLLHMVWLANPAHGLLRAGQKRFGCCLGPVRPHMGAVTCPCRLADLTAEACGALVAQVQLHSHLRCTAAAVLLRRLNRSRFTALRAWA